MAGAGQVGAAIALWVKCRKNKQLTKLIKGALPVGILGVGEPLIYGVTLPLGRRLLLLVLVVVSAVPLSVLFIMSVQLLLGLQVSL